MADLETRKFGKTNMTPKALGLGCYSLGKEDHTDGEAAAAVKRAIELGIDFIDTSPLYGESERRVGLALQGGLRDKIYLQTKTGTHPERQYDYSAESTRWSVENSLRLLKTDYLDSVLIHDPRDIEDPLAPGHALDVLLEMKQKGKIGHVGLGVRQHEFHRRAMETGQMDVVLTYLDYTLLDQSAAETVIPMAEKRGVGLILASVLATGKLSGHEPEENTRAHSMWDWCRRRGLNVRDLAIQFCMTLPIDGIVMPGPGRKEHVEEAYRAATTDIPPEIWAEFEVEFGVAPYKKS